MAELISITAGGQVEQKFLSAEEETYFSLKTSHKASK
jgi:hypothetical protein